MPRWHQSRVQPLFSSPIEPFGSPMPDEKELRKSLAGTLGSAIAGEGALGVAAGIGAAAFFAGLRAAAFFTDFFAVFFGAAFLADRFAFLALRPAAFLALTAPLRPFFLRAGAAFFAFLAFAFVRFAFFAMMIVLPIVAATRFG
jgi:hypothetical protein